MSRTITRSALALMLGVLLLVVASPARADVDGEVKAGAYTDSSEGFIGAGILVNLDQEKQWYFNPTFEYAPVENGDLTTVNMDFHYDLPTRGPAVWLGAGPALIYRDQDPGFGSAGGSDTDLGVDLIAGVGAKRGSVRPFGQAKVIVADDSMFVIGGGVRW